jgi:hypothetical protein
MPKRADHEWARENLLTEQKYKQMRHSSQLAKAADPATQKCEVDPISPDKGQQ